MSLRYGSVCSGIEAATAAWHPLGWEPAWFCEIDAFPSAVLAHHHPQVPNYGDFTQLLDPTHPARNGDLIDLLVGGTPCQSFSYAGVRAGLDDPRGHLMLKYLDLVGVLRPRWVVWENVPGVLSSGGGRDFGALLGGLADLGYGVAYRVLDARHFGVPQRRRRVFVVGHSGGDPERAARVLALDEGVRGHSAARGKSRKEAAAAVGSGAAVGGEQVTTSTANMGGNDGGVYADGTVATLRVEAQPPVAFAQKTRDEIRLIGGDGAIAGCLSAESGTHQTTYILVENVAQAANAFQLPVGVDIYNHTITGDVSVTMCSKANGSYNGSSPMALVAIPDPAYCVAGRTFGRDSQDTYVVAKADADKGDQDTYVRRLTPRECERLQGFPDNWTAILYKGKPATDGHRYKALGNSMAVPVMRWIGERLAEEDKR